MRIPNHGFVLPELSVVHIVHVRVAVLAVVIAARQRYSFSLRQAVRSCMR